METNTNNYCDNYKQNNNSSGLLRYRSAPTSFLENFVDKNIESSSVHGNSNSEIGVNGFAQLPPQYPGPLGMNSGGVSMGMDHQSQAKIGGSSLVRQNSSPAGYLTSQTGYATMRGVGTFGMAHDYTSGTANANLSPSSRRLKNHLNLPSRVPQMLARIAEVDNENGGTINDPKVENSSGEDLFFSSGFPFGSWNDSSNCADTFIKRELADNDDHIFAHTDQPNMLSRHLSLPNGSTSEMEKLLQFQDTIPCKLRAKRGCATHPRSIAERVRRTKISERMRKLQELVPNMDKQTNTADMLDLAVEYIKDLQNEYKTLSDYRANCKCSASRTVVSNQPH